MFFDLWLWKGPVVRIQCFIVEDSFVFLDKLIGCSIRRKKLIIYGQLMSLWHSLLKTPHIGFTEQCALGDLEDLLSEGNESNIKVCDHIVSVRKSTDWVKKSSDFYPISTRCPEIDTFQKLIERDLMALALQLCANICTKWDNLSYKETKALKCLEKDTSIVIKKSDKGDLVVVMSADMYRSEADRQLSDSDT